MKLLKVLKLPWKIILIIRIFFSERKLSAAEEYQNSFPKTFAYSRFGEEQRWSWRRACAETSYASNKVNRLKNKLKS